jgi:serine/threonine protein kinase
VAWHAQLTDAGKEMRYNPYEHLLLARVGTWRDHAVNADAYLESLLCSWHTLHEQGQSVTPTDLCGDHPELLPQLQQCVNALLSIKRSRKVGDRLPSSEDLTGLSAQLHPPGASSPSSAVATVPPQTTGPLDPATGDPYATRRTALPPSVPCLAELQGWATPSGYEILGELGRGGMGVVYQARQIKANRVVALKMILSSHHAAPADKARFQIEAEAIARLQHPHIVQLHEVGEVDGQPFFSLEFCPGGSLEKKLRGTPLSPAEAAALVETLARAMHTAHTKGIVHRDLKPANVLLGEDGTPKISDFGLAKKLGEAGQTASGAVIGTPSYMAPEQAGGKIREMGPATDVYALGAILYECLTGRPPFRAATSLDTLVQVVTEDPVAPTRLQSTVPRDLETICLKCLQKAPAQRYPSAEALADDLRRFQAGQPIQARPPSLLRILWLWSRRHLALVVSSLAMVLLLTLGSVVLAWTSYRAYQNVETIRQCEQPLRDLHGQIALYDEILTSSAQLAATTGDVAWEKRYREHDVLLDQAIARAIELAPELQPIVANVDDANRELVRLEDRTFHLVRAGKLTQARTIVQSEEYLRFKQRYAAALTQLTAHLDQHSDRALAVAYRQARAFTILAFSLVALTALLLIAAGCTLVWTRRWS